MDIPIIRFSTSLPRASEFLRKTSTMDFMISVNKQDLQGPFTTAALLVKCKNSSRKLLFNPTKQLAND